MNTNAKALAAIAFFSTALNLHAQITVSPIQEPSAPGGMVLQVHVNSVLVPVIVRDAQGHELSGLKQDDFKVFDQGKKRAIAGFSIEEGAPSDAVAPSLLTPGPANPAAPAATAPRRFIVFLFDDRHLGLGDIVNVQKAGAQLLSQPLADSDRAVVLSFQGVNSGMTHDRAALQAAVMKLKANSLFKASTHECPDLSYYAADQILNKHSASEYQIAIEKAANCTHSQDTNALQQLVRGTASVALENGDEDVRETLSYIRDVVHTMSKLPGQRILILISPGFLSTSDESLTLQSQILDLAAGSNVTFNTLDGRGLYSSNVPAGESGSGTIFGDITGQPLEDQLESMRENEDIMAKLAQGTGGTFFHHANDIAGGLKTLAAGPAFKYLLECSVDDVKRNGSYHTLKVEVDKSGVTLQARAGYFAPLPPKKRK
jgi:VWFA-related protein